MHIVVDLSAHGFGHAGMTAPIVARLPARFPGVRITVRSALPARVLRERLAADFELAPPPPDPGMAMHSPFSVDAAASATWYEQLYESWDESVCAQAAQLDALGADLLFANIPFLSLEAARLAGIPALAYCSLNWADVYRAHAEPSAQAAAIHARMQAAYRCADVFLQPQPSMPMDDLTNRLPIGPVARVSSRAGGPVARVSSRAGGPVARMSSRAPRKLPGAERRVLLSFGGISGAHVLELPRIEHVRWLVPDEYSASRADITRHSDSGLAFIDLLASCDAAVTKPGYGMFVEAACNGVRVAYLPRDEWPEARYLCAWLHEHATALELDEDRVQEGRLASDIAELLERPARAAVTPTGIEQALDAIDRAVRRGAL